jgi:hypothetical protein
MRDVVVCVCRRKRLNTHSQLQMQKLLQWRRSPIVSRSSWHKPRRTRSVCSQEVHRTRARKRKWSWRACAGEKDIERGREGGREKGRGKRGEEALEDMSSHTYSCMHTYIHVYACMQGISTLACTHAYIHTCREYILARDKAQMKRKQAVETQERAADLVQMANDELLAWQKENFKMEELRKLAEREQRRSKDLAAKAFKDAMLAGERPSAKIPVQIYTV